MESFQFDWDEQNLGHLALHQISSTEAEQVINNRPLDLESELRNGETRLPHIGETDAGRVLVVVSTMRARKFAWSQLGRQTRTTGAIFCR